MTLPSSRPSLCCRLSDQEDYEGGQLLLAFNNSNPTDFHYVVQADRGSGLIFDSYAKHSISPLTAGLRSVLVVEFWTAFESTIGHLRPVTSEAHLWDWNDARRDVKEDDEYGDDSGSRDKDNISGSNKGIEL